MAYIGSTPTSQNFTSGTDYFSGTGSQTAYTLTRTVNSVNDIEVVINNVVQQPSTAYTLSGTTITFTSAPSSGTNNIYVRYLATNMQSFTVPANSITRSQLDSNLQAGFQGRNKIINGSMVVDQRNAGSSVTITSDSTYTLDRWKARMSQASKYSVQQNAGSVTPPVGFTKYIGCTSLSAYTSSGGDFFSINQLIEGNNVSDLAWGTADAKTVTLSFWVRSSLTGTFGGSFTSGVDFNYSYPFTYVINSANTWEYKTVTVIGPTTGNWSATTGSSIEMWFTIGLGSTYAGTANTWQSGGKIGPSGCVNVVGTSGATFYITGVQLEEGTTATSFEREAYSVTLQKCERYYEVCNSNTGDGIALASGFYASSTNCRAIQTFHTKKRATPTIALGSGASWGGAAGTPSINAGVDVVSYNASNYFVAYNGSGTATLTASAEL